MRRDWNWRTCDWLKTPALLFGIAFILTHAIVGLFIYSVEFAKPVPALQILAAVVPLYTGILFLFLLVPYLLVKLYKYVKRTRPVLRPFVVFLGLSLLAAVVFLEELMRTNMLEATDYTFKFFVTFIVMYTLSLTVILSLPYLLILGVRRLRRS